MGFLDNLPTSFASLKETIGAIGNQGSSSVLGIDIGSSAIKVVQLRNDDGAAVLETYGELSLGPYQDIEIGRAVNLDVDRLSEALRDILREANVTTKDCGVSIPFASSLITLLELPKVDSKTLKSMLPLEARKYIPVPISEVQLDWFVVPEGDLKYLSKEEGGEGAPAADGEHADTIHVLLVAIHNEISRKYETVLRGADLKPTFFEIEIFSSIRSILGRGVAPVVVVDIGAARSKIYIVEAGIVRSTHVINRGAQDITLAFAKSTGIPITRAEELKREFGLNAEGSGEHGPRLAQAALSGMEYIFAEAERAILAYQRRYHANISQVVLTGGGATLKGLLPLAQKKFEREVFLADPFKKARSPAFLEEVLQEAGPEFAVAVGLALRKLQG